MKLQNMDTITIGIWGFGIVGKAAAAFLYSRNARVILYDANPEIMKHTPYIVAPSREAFFDAADYILPSPGIDIRNYRSLHSKKWIAELDLFYAYFEKPIIAITGSVGKTTVTHTLTQILKQQGINAVAAGNIGQPLLTLIDQQEFIDIAVLELSSFQLEFIQSFAPDLAIWTNFYPNHFDRHTNLDGYFNAKIALLRYQNKNQKALVPYTLKEKIETEKINSSLTFFSPECINQPVDASLFCSNHTRKEMHHHSSNKSIPLDAIASNIFSENKLIIWAALELMQLPLHAENITTLEHRLEKVATINGITFYNDSKSTIPAATITAIEQLKENRLLLFLGGLSKGIDRTPLIKKLQSYSVHVFCFGKEAPEIKALCDSFAIQADAHANLESAFAACTLQLQPYDCILFSPAGSSFDLFKDYQERGKVFKQLVHHYKKRAP